MNNPISTLAERVRDSSCDSFPTHASARERSFESTLAHSTSLSLALSVSVLPDWSASWAAAGCYCVASESAGERVEVVAVVEVGLWLPTVRADKLLADELIV